MAAQGRKRPRARGRGDLIAALDIGTTKVVCLVGHVDASGRPRIRGVGHTGSRGMRAGAITDMEAAETAIGTAVDTAERMAGETVREVVVSLSCGQPTSHTVAVEIAIAGHEVGEADIRRALGSVDPTEFGADAELVHLVPVSYALDGTRGISDPRGMVGDRLDIDVHLVTANAAAVRNLATCVGRCHLDVDAFVVSPYAAGLACLVADEQELGCTVIDLGGGTTTVAVFLGGKLVFTDQLPVGGIHVTNDVAHGLMTSVAYAERMKTLYGNAVASLSDEHETLAVPLVGEDEATPSHSLPKSALTAIIQPRMEEILELVRGRLEYSGFYKETGRRVVLTGGGSQLQGVRELAQSILDKQVRLGRPGALAGLGETVGGPAFATAAGLLLYAAREPGDLALAAGLDDPPATGLWTRLEGWLRAHL